jgi:apolipoprotein D and lipocalin family protein
MAWFQKVWLPSAWVAPVLAGMCALQAAVPVAAAEPATAQVRSVAAVDLGRYTGTWFEIASYPMFFQRKCVGDTTAEYSALPDGGIRVHNRCRSDAGFISATGKATVVEGSGNARLKVSFFWPFRADYWVIGLDPDYRWAVVGNPGRDYLWVLSRTPQLPPELLDAALTSARAQGFGLEALRFTTHTNAP